MKKDFSKLKKSEKSTVSKKFVNILKLLNLFDSGKTFTVKELAVKLDITEKTVYRYLKTLNAADIKIYRDPITMRYSFFKNDEELISVIDNEKKSEMIMPAEDDSSEGINSSIAYFNNKENEDSSVLWEFEDHSYDCILVINNEAKIEYWNRAAEKIFGYKKGSALGETFCGLLVPQRTRKKYSEMFFNLKHDKNMKDYDNKIEIDFMRRDGVEFKLGTYAYVRKMQGRDDFHVILRIPVPIFVKLKEEI